MNLFIQETKKLLKMTLADPRSLAAGIIAPTIILAIFALTFGNFAALKLAVVDNDQGEMGQALTESIFAQTSPLTQKPYFEKVATSDSEEAESLYSNGKVNGIITIPEDFSEELEAGHHAPIDYAFKNDNTDMAKNLRLYLDEGILSFYQENVPGIDLQLEREYLVDAQLDWFAIIAVGVFLLSFLMGAMFNYLYLYNKERFYNTLTEYRLATKSLTPTFAARLVVALLAGLVGSTINALLIWLLTGVNIAPHAAQVLPILLILGISFVSFAALVAMLVRTFSGAAMFAMISVVIIWFLSGATTSVKYATGALLNIALALPSSYGLSQIRATIFEVDQSIGGLLAPGKGWLIMSLYATILAVGAYRAYHHQLSTPDKKR